MARIGEIPTTLQTIFDEAASKSLDTNIVADRMAQERIFKGAPPQKGEAAILARGHTRGGEDNVARVDG
jgi:hypothetical protein